MVEGASRVEGVSERSDRRSARFGTLKRRVKGLLDAG
jgi:hypothetical protein